MKLVETLRADDPVPEWLLAASPASPVARLGSFTVAYDIEIYQRGEEYWVLPLSPQAAPPFQISDSDDLAISAGNLRVVVPLTFISFEVDGSGGAASASGGKL